jgi:demethylspheroidene O-methyltransferase
VSGVAAPEGRVAVSEPGGGRAVRWRDRLLTQPRFQRWVARTPLLRLLARRHAAALFELCTGFVNSQVLYACVQSGLIEALAAGALPLVELQRCCALSGSQLELLLAASDALGLTEPRPQQRRGLGLLGAALLGNAAVLRMIEHQPSFYADMTDPIGLLRGAGGSGRLAAYWAYARRQQPQQLGAAAVEGYSALMAATQPLIADDLLDAYPFRRHRCALDVGGGDGVFLCALAARVPALRLMLFDLPAVAERARARLAAAGLSARSQVHGGDFAQVALPPGADVITLLRVVHDHDDDVALRLLRAVHRALPATGQVVIAEPMRALPGSLPAAERYLGFYLLAMGQGHVRSAAELERLLRVAGFTRMRAHRTARPWQCGVISACAA